MMRLRVLACLVASVALGGCALKDPYPRNRSDSALPPALPLPPAFQSSGTTPSSAQGPGGAQPTGGRSGPEPSRLPSAPPGAAGGPRHAIYRFALVYNNMSVPGAATRGRRLASLSTPALARSFDASSNIAESLAARGLPPGGRMVARVISISMDPPQDTYDHGEVVVAQALQRADGFVEPPLTSTFSVDVLQVGGRWRVASFSSLS
jgi:hypothetical protein